MQTTTLHNTLGLGLALGLLWSCAGSPPPAAPPTANLTPPDQDKPADGWDCSGNLVPPAGWEQETAFADSTSPNALQNASESAKGQLIGRLCGSSLGCDFLAARVKTWKTGSGAGQACAMAVIRKEDLTDWRTLASQFDRDLDRAVGQLLDNAKRVAIDRIVDSGVPGGQRALWLQNRMEQALTRVDITLIEPPAGWNGDRPPPGVDRVLRASVTPRLEQGTKVIEVTWKARYLTRGAIAKKSADAITLPADIAPSINGLYPSLPIGAKDITLRLDSRYGGGLCMGETTQVWLHSKRDLHVRVFDLYGRDGALLLFPNAQHPSGQVKANQRIAVGPDSGFQAVPWPGTEAERFLVIAAPTRQG
ncbi:MAG: hypothetical protein AAFX99_19220, partial [Myxococcota bacterium]